MSGLNKRLMPAKDKALFSICNAMMKCACDTAGASAGCSALLAQQAMWVCVHTMLQMPQQVNALHLAIYVCLKHPARGKQKPRPFTYPAHIVGGGAHRPEPFLSLQALLVCLHTVLRIPAQGKQLARALLGLPTVWLCVHKTLQMPVQDRFFHLFC